MKKSTSIQTNIIKIPEIKALINSGKKTGEISEDDFNSVMDKLSIHEADRGFIYAAIEKLGISILDTWAMLYVRDEDVKMLKGVDDTVSQYLSAIGGIPMMNQADTFDGIRKAQEGLAAAQRLKTLQDIAGETETPIQTDVEQTLISTIKAGERAKNAVVEGHLRLVVSVAKKYASLTSSMSLLDLVQEGNIGLIRSIDSFDVNRGVKFSTYATIWIKQSIIQAINKTDDMIRKPTYLNDGSRKASVAITEMGKMGLPNENPLDIAKYMVGPSWDSLSKKKQNSYLHIINYTLSKSNQLASLDEPVKAKTNNAEPDTPLSEFIASDNERDNPEISATYTLLHEKIKELLRKLPVRDACVLRLRFGLEDGRTYTLAEIGKEIGLTRECIRRIENSAINQLRGHREQLEDFAEDIQSNADNESEEFL